MKIALVSPYDYPYPGGVQQHICHLSRQFRLLGHEVRIIAPSSEPSDALAAQDIYKVGNVVPIPANGSVARITLSLRMSGRVKAILERERFDIVHLHEPLAPALPLTVLRYSDSVNIGTFHHYGSRGLTYFYGRPILKRFFDRLDGRIAVSRPALDFIATYFPGDYTIIPNGIDVEAFRPDGPLVAELRDGRPTILFVGRLEKRKGFKYLIQAFGHVRRALPTARLVVVGGYTQRQARWYERYVRCYSLGDVRFVGYVPAADLPLYYRSCDLFCAPSIGGESFGIILLEAMASGCPIVASSIPGYAAVMESGVHGLLVPPKDAHALAEAIIEILSDPARRAAMGAAGRRHAEGFAWPRIAARVLAYYEQVMAQGGLSVLPPALASGGTA
jgi:phosphatidylinositol alpha-mannosyltransferase